MEIINKDEWCIADTTRTVILKDNTGLLVMEFENVIKLKEKLFEDFGCLDMNISLRTIHKILHGRFGF